MLTDDLRRTVPTYTAPAGAFEVVTVPPLQYLMIDGHGDPAGPAFRRAVAALFPFVYGLRFLSRARFRRDQVVMPLEALWWSGDATGGGDVPDPDRSSWTLLVAQPGWITEEHVRSVRRLVPSGRGAPSSSRVRLETLDEGLVVQTLFIGPYSDEAPTIEAMHRVFLPTHGLRGHGRHHEVYLSDPRRTEPARLRTILRQPVTAAGA